MLNPLRSPATLRALFSIREFTLGYLDRGEGQCIYYEHLTDTAASESDKPTLLLSHGFGMAGRVWDNTTAWLRDQGYAVVCYDHRNCGQSDKDFADVSISALGDDVVALCETLNLSRVVLNGWSLGGAVVVDAAPKLGNRLTGLILTGGATPRYTQTDDFALGGQPADVAATVAALRADRVNFLKGLYFEGVFAKEVSDDVKTWCWHLALQASSGADASLGALADVEQRNILTNLAIPTLVVVGTEDAVVPADIGRAAAGMMSSATLVEMAGCGHAPFLEDTAGYHKALHKFISAL